jgi:hypothetical protein
MAKFEITKAYYEVSEPKEGSFTNIVSYGNDGKQLFVDITLDLNSLLQASKNLIINPFERGFGGNISTIINEAYQKLSNNIQYSRFNSKIYLEIVNKDLNQIEGKYFFCRDDGWQKRDKEDKLIATSDSNQQSNIIIFNETDDNSASISSDTQSVAQKIKDRISSIVDKTKKAPSDLEKKVAGTGGVSGTTSEQPPSIDSIVYNEHNSDRVRQLQRCLIRTAPEGNYAKEKQSAENYVPVVGVRKKGTGNYADDGWFGPATLAAVDKYKDVLNKLNAGNEQAQISNTKAVPAAILSSEACKDKMGTEPTDKEAKETSAATQATSSVVSESKVYKEFSFLSTKNERLHTTLMEQLKKDLKRG